MQRIGKSTLLFSAIALALSQGAPLAADARRVTVDDPWPMPSAGFCALDPKFDSSDCNAVSLGFWVGDGDQAYDSIYV